MTRDPSPRSPIHRRPPEPAAYVLAAALVGLVAVITLLLPTTTPDVVLACMGAGTIALAVTGVLSRNYAIGAHSVTRGKRSIDTARLTDARVHGNQLWLSDHRKQLRLPITGSHATPDFFAALRQAVHDRLDAPDLTCNEQARELLTPPASDATTSVDDQPASQSQPALRGHPSAPPDLSWAWWCGVVTAVSSTVSYILSWADPEMYALLAPPDRLLLTVLLFIGLIFTLGLMVGWILLFTAAYRRKRWARITVTILGAIGVVLNALSLLGQGDAKLLGGTLNTIVVVVCIAATAASIALLNTPTARQFYRPAAPALATPQHHDRHT